MEGVNCEICNPKCEEGDDFVFLTTKFQFIKRNKEENPSLEKVQHGQKRISIKAYCPTTLSGPYTSAQTKHSIEKRP